MQESKEIKALLTLIEDPDEEIYQTVSDHIVSLGKDIIPNLENLWENELSEATQERIELLIHRLHFKDLKEEISTWISAEGNLLSGAIIIAKYHHPNLNINLVLQEIEKIRRNTWLELNNYLTPIEKISVINSILYNYFNLTGVEMDYQKPDHFQINKTLETKTGNSISIGIIYLILCDLLDVPVSAMNIPQQFLLGYFDDYFDISNPTGHPSQKVVFYIDPLSGQMYTHSDIEMYYKRLEVVAEPAHFRAKRNHQVLALLLSELSKCFDDDNNKYKMLELIQLKNMLEK